MEPHQSQRSERRIRWELGVSKISVLSGNSPRAQGHMRTRALCFSEDASNPVFYLLQ